MNRPRILLIENNETWIQILKTDVEGAVDADAIIQVSGNYRDAATQLRDSWDLLVLDLQLSETGSAIHEGINLASEADNKGVPIIVVTGETLAGDEIERLRRLRCVRNFFAKKPHYDVDDFRRVIKETLEGDHEKGRRTPSSVPPSTKRVFICHGRNLEAVAEIKKFLDYIGLDAVTYMDVCKKLGGAPYAGKVLAEGLNATAAILVLFTPDECARLSPTLSNHDENPVDLERRQARPNVMFEAGMALAMAEDRTILVTMGDVQLMSNVSGRHCVRLTNAEQRRLELFELLQNMGCSVKPVGRLSDVSVAGNFEACVT